MTIEDIKLDDSERTKTEVWKDVVGYENMYQVSNFGRVKSLERKFPLKIGSKFLRTKKEKILKQWRRSKYNLVDLWKNGERCIKSVHVLVYETFRDKIPEGFFIHHIDENKQNNNVDNLNCISCLEHNRLHHVGKPSWNKGLHTGNQYTRKFV